MREEIFISGFGGQGIILAGELLAKAALIKGYYAVVTKFYGAEVRGGPVSSGIIISDKPILFQFVRKPDVLLALHESGVRAHAPREVKLAIVDEDLVRKIDVKCDKVLRAPIIRTAEEIGSQAVANVVLLGIFSAFSGLVSERDLGEAIRKSVRAKYIDINLKAVRKGLELGKQIIGEIH